MFKYLMIVSLFSCVNKSDNEYIKYKLNDGTIIECKKPKYYRCGAVFENCLDGLTYYCKKKIKPLED